MTRPNCDICCGSGKIRLPVYPPIGSPRDHDGGLASLDEAVREYQCPECGNEDTVSVERAYAIAVADRHHAKTDPRLKVKIERNLALSCADRLYRDGFFTITWSDEMDRNGCVNVRAVITAVHPTNMQPFEEKVRARQFEIAAEVATAAKARILNWGSEYTNHEGPIRKGMACEDIDKALERVREKHAIR